MDADIQKALKQDCFLSENVNDALEQSQNYLSINTFLFTSKSSIVMSIKSWLAHIMQNKTIYVMLQARDQDFLTKVLFHLETGIQIHLTSCTLCKDRYNVDDKCLDVERDHHDILAYRFMVTYLSALSPRGKPREKLNLIKNTNEVHQQVIMMMESHEQSTRNKTFGGN